MKIGQCALIVATSITLAACGEESDEDVVANYVADVDAKYADEADCISKELTAAVGTNKMEKWATKIREDGKIGSLDLSFMSNLPKAAKKCLEK